MNIYFKNIQLLFVGILLLATEIFSDKIDLKPGVQTVCLPKDGYVVTLTLPPCTNKIPVDVYTPEDKKVVADVLVLNGWSFPRDDWQKKTRILKSESHDK